MEDWVDTSGHYRARPAPLTDRQKLAKLRAFVEVVAGAERMNANPYARDMITLEKLTQEAQQLLEEIDG